MTMNAAQCLLEGGDDAAIAVVCRDEQFRRDELRDAVARAAGAWRELGLECGDRVAIKLSDGCDWLIAYLGAIWAGGVAVGVNPRVPADEWRAITVAAQFRYILVESTDDALAPDATRLVALADWRRRWLAATPVAPLAMDDEAPALWVHSSGTSGKPKAVIHAQRCAREIERVGCERLGIRTGDRIYASSKLFFSYPLANSVFTGLKLGATVILDPDWPTAAAIVDTVDAQRANVLFSVPSLYRNLLKEGLASRLRDVRLLASAGEALPASLRTEWKRQTGQTIVDGFGASETLVLALVDRGDGQAFQISPGLAVQALEPAAVPGRLLIHGSVVALAYWQRPESDALHFVAGGFAPSDLFESAGPASWRFAGREDSLVKVHGRWVDLIELEQRIAQACPGMAEAAAVSVPDADGVEAVALFYVPLEGAPAVDTEALHEHANRLPPYQRPRWLHAVEALPRTATGKLLRRRLRDLHTTLAAPEIGHDHH